MNPPPMPPIPEPAIIAARGYILRVRPASRSNYSELKRLSPSVIVLHCTDGCEGTTKDDDTAAMFAGELKKKRSAHYVVDADSVTRCVPDLMTAWHCGHHGNAIGLGIELCGRASQTRAQWLDAFSLPTLSLAARLCADLCLAYEIPPSVANEVALRAGQPGITTHAYVAKAFPKDTDHTDPGPGFPLASFVAAVARAMQGLPAPNLV